MGRKKNTHEDFIYQCIKIHGDKYDYSKVIYKGNRDKIIINCLSHGEFEQRAYNHKAGQGCPKCKIDNQKLNSEKFIKKFRKLYNRNYILIDNYIDYKTKIKIKCNKHGEFLQSPEGLMKGYQCPNCLKEDKPNLNSFIEKSTKIHGDKYDYSKVNFINNRTKVIIICREHGEFKQRPSDHYYGNGCPVCRESRGERNIRKLLTDNNITFETQHKFNDCRNVLPLPFDFYLPELNICIEYNGVQHYKPFEHFGGEEGFKERQRNDKIKMEYCKNNNINLITIKYNQNINVLNKKLV